MKKYENLKAVVLCKYCEYHEATGIVDDTIYCDLYSDYRGTDEFCSRGERKERE